MLECLIMIFILIFKTENEYLLWGSFVCFIIWVPIGAVVISINKSKGKFRIYKEGAVCEIYRC